MKAILPIIEGQSEEESVPILLRKIRDRISAFTVQISHPFRIKRNKIVREGELERAIEYALKDRVNVEAIFILLDADDDCPVLLADQIRARCASITALPVAVVVANRELEGWFLGGKESLRGIRSIRMDATGPQNPEDIRGAKERLSRNMENGARYIEVDDQPAFATHLDFELTRSRCRSFQKFLTEAQHLFSILLKN